MSKGAQTRDRLIRTTASLLESQGYHGTGLSQVVTESGAPKGSLYFHFPGGKRQLAAQALGSAAEAWRKRLRDALADATSAGQAMMTACELLAKRLEKSGFVKGCPVATTTLEMAVVEEDIRVVCSQHFRAWESYIGELLLRAGVQSDRAEAEASFALSAIEGALLLSRAHRSTLPLHHAGTILRSHLDEVTERTQDTTETPC